MLSLVRPPVWRLGLLTSILILAGLLGLAGCAAPPPPVVPIEAEPELGLRPVTFDRLAGWSEDDPREALIAFRRSCAKLRSSGSGPMGPEPLFGAVADWLAVCAAANEHASAPSPESVRRFFETWFQPYQVFDDDEPEGLFTGYYEPVLHGSRRSGPHYPVPLHAPPPDLLRIDLGRFNPDLAGYAIYGRIGDGEFLPYYSRAEIERGVLTGQNLELLWVDDPIAKFFLQIQGSGRVRLDDGSVVRVGYASQNGHPYRAIGRDLIEIGALSRDEVSLQTIRAWLQAHPDDAAVIMARNRSYIFFHEHPQLAAEDGPLGAQGVPLTAGRSLAVDRRYIPLGVPLWLETTAPGPEGALPLRRLMIAQDTGGAIKGVVRGDVFWGAGERAEAVAGRMKSPGRYAVLLPRALVPTS
jgi:membrane-bound lytic murein transglycosylase A